MNRQVYEAEKRGLHFADYIVAVSNYTKGKIVSHYGIAPQKVFVVHNAVEKDVEPSVEEFGIKKHNKVVLFLGRITLQKGPDYFIYAARKVLEKEPEARFVMAGTGDMEPFIMDKAAEMGMADKILFTGFLSGNDVNRIYRMADVYVMPSVSEPFGITALEAMKNSTPVILSKNSGVSEIVSHCLKVDFWDINQLANKIIGVLRYKELKSTLAENAESEVGRISWESPASKCIEIYRRAGAW